ncbi:protoporphyrinogen oxidase HemJ [Halovulum dunhuangense]|uniref:Protoporphyrinogen IX oxidase n=1 Tax=Halovulum dunhuangense TaxID=1505036 RepID=A0A849KZH2_9RHOB|nr:protoporphyrinogen oxidase HemJ [Halovulum dunhuangense]NNU79094.1 protoporphyrinogen oxidase HemJ [Halovulum dunhuangense]
MLVSLYPWLKAFHIMAVIAWMAGLFYLPRLFVHHAERAAPGSEMAETFVMMEQKLLRLIMNPSMIASWVLGVLLILSLGLGTVMSEGWFHVKLTAVIAMTVFHMWCARHRRLFAEGGATLSGRRYRIMNEVPTLLMIVIVIMVVVKPF